MRPAVAVAVGLLLAGCYRATVTVQPSSALIGLPDGTMAGPPAQVVARPWPLRATPIVVEAPGYRTYATKVRWRLGAALGRGRSVDVLLVPEHARSGE
jgi:hypothetical protein